MRIQTLALAATLLTAGFAAPAAAQRRTEPTLPPRADSAVGGVTADSARLVPSLGHDVGVEVARYTLLPAVVTWFSAGLLCYYLRGIGCRNRDAARIAAGGIAFELPIGLLIGVQEGRRKHRARAAPAATAGIAPR